MFFILEYYPYNMADGVKNLIGPFDSRTEAEEWSREAASYGAHPDSEWTIIEPRSPVDRLLKLQKEDFES